MSISESGVITWTPETVGEYGPVTVLVQDGGEDGAAPGSETFTVLVDYDYMVGTNHLECELKLEASQ